jgi:hypothetical protein
MKDTLKLLALASLGLFLCALPFIVYSALVYVLVHFIHKLW